MRLGNEKFHILLERGAILGGAWGSFTVLPSSLFEARLKDAEGHQMQISADDAWESILTEAEGEWTRVSFGCHECAKGISVVLWVKCDQKGISWRQRVENPSRPR